MPKVLFVCTVPTDKSGIPNVIFNLLERLDPNEFHIGYVSINEPSELFKEKLSKINAELFVIPRKIYHPLRYIHRVAKAAKGYDIIHVHGNSATMVLEMMAAKMAGVNVRIAHSHNTNCNMKLIDALARPLFYKLCNGRLACGVEAGRWLFKGRDFKVINNGINVEHFLFDQSIRKTIRTRLRISDEYIIGHIGNFVAQKNHSFLIDIFNAFTILQPNSRLLLLGDGPLKTLIQSKVDSLGLTNRVIFAGSVNQPQEYMNAMDVVVMPSLFEGLPLTLIEEQANGLSIVASDTITQNANITGSVLYLSFSENHNIWATRIKNVLESRNHNSESSSKGIKKIQEAKYDIDSAVKQLEQYYYSHMTS